MPVNNASIMSHSKPITAQVLELLQHEDFQVGDHLPAQMLADRLDVSRSPINETLQSLAENGLLRREPNRGYFLARKPTGSADKLLKKLGVQPQDAVADAYFQIADDRLKGQLPDTFSETLIKTRYGLTATQLQSVLKRMALEGWAGKRAGYGWAFSPMLTTSDSLFQSYRLRLALEPAALLEPGYKLDPAVIERCRAAEMHLLDGGIEKDTALQLHERGVRFHEALVEASGNSFFIDTIRRVNSVRRLLSYRSMKDRKRYKEHCIEHLKLLDLLEKGRNEEASNTMRAHLNSTLKNLQKITNILSP
jgi:DNA-binding GntR family transcriptional regulator